MADNFEVNPASGGATFAADEIGGVFWQRVKATFGLDGAATDVSSQSPLPAEPVFNSPQRTYASAVSIAAGSSADLDSDQITSGATASLVAVSVGAAVPVKAELHTVTNGVASSVLATLFTWPGKSEYIPLPSRQFITVAHDAGAGFDGFRVVATNQNTGSGSSDLHATFYYDEVT